MLDQLSTEHPLYDKVVGYYNSIVSNVQKHFKLPSFCSRSAGKAQNIELEWNGTEYTTTLTDTNNVLGNYSFSADASGFNFSVNGNKLTITTKDAPSTVVGITVNKKESLRRGLITWSDGKYIPGVGIQDLVSYVDSVNDPITGYLNLKVSYGSAELQKVSEDGKVEGISFTVTGDDFFTTIKTDINGRWKLDNLTPGVYTVTEQSDDRYNPQEIRRVTVVSGQTATVTFNNTLKRGDLTVIKTSEDNFVAGIKFRLTGTSLAGIPVNEYAVTNASGIAQFKDVLIGTGYVLSEVDTDIRYVVPENQTAAIEWNKVTEKAVNNTLKKWNLTVTKSDSETGTPQGDASLAGAVYGIYKGNQLIDSYTTDANGRFTTDYYVCGDDWSLREISPSVGYLLNTDNQHIGAEAKLYTAQYNLAAPLSSLEDVIKGTISLIAFAYCIIKIFFANIKRGGILIIQMAVGALYMFSVPRGYSDGFNQWCKQIVAICLTAFMQTTLLYLGLLTFPGNMLLGLGVMLAANEVPRIAQQFGLDSSVRVNMMSVVHATTTAVNLTRSVARAAGK